MTVDEPPLLSEPEVVRAAHDGTLPPRWRFALTDGSLRPLFARGAEVTIERGAPAQGALACVVAGERVRFRRVLARRRDACLLRGELAPFEDGWSTDVVGTVATPTRLGRVAQRAPRVWTQLGWWGAWLTARARGLPARIRSASRSAPPFRVALLTSQHRDALAGLLTRVYGAGRRSEPAAGARDLHLGLFTPDGALVGRTWLAVRDREGYSHTTIVEPGWRGRGGGTALVRAAVDAARARGLLRVRAHIAARNFASRVAYARVGFAPTGRWWSDAHDPFAAAEQQLIEVAVELR